MSEINTKLRLLEINRSSYCYKGAIESIENMELAKIVDKKYTKHPFYGSRLMAAFLKNEGYLVNRKRVGLELNEFENLTFSS